MAVPGVCVTARVRTLIPVPRLLVLVVHGPFCCLVVGFLERLDSSIVLTVYAGGKIDVGFDSSSAFGLTFPYQEKALRRC